MLYSCNDYYAYLSQNHVHILRSVCASIMSLFCGYSLVFGLTLIFLLSPMRLDAGYRQQQESSNQLGHAQFSFGHASQMRIPVFSSVNGYVCFFLRAEALSPSKKRVGVFSIPRHGLLVENLVLDFRSTELSVSDWRDILDLIEPLGAMELSGALDLVLPDVAATSTNLCSTVMPWVADGQVFVTINQDGVTQELALSYDSENKITVWKFNQKKNDQEN